MLFAITLNYLRPPEDIQAQLEAHKAWLVRYIQTGNILFAGPLHAKAGGFVLAHASEQAEIQNMIAEDPFHIHKLVSFDVQATEPVIRAENFSGHWAADAKAIPKT
ncbi:YciI family protein [Uliginosibacterium gangwonense]|uniref:YciI family protein n=1 Tax=Uliginosibacterium gangwonense TaxID=392736 RepID=UPI000382A099|nr:YciI family protein [Uliginosibacterium gangwonense]